jgi:hypothetical protein
MVPRLLTPLIIHLAHLVLFRPFSNNFHTPSSNSCMRSTTNVLYVGMPVGVKIVLVAVQFKGASGVGGCKQPQ